MIGLSQSWYESDQPYSTEQAPFTRVFQSGTHFTAESTDTMQIEFHAHEHNTDATGV